MIPSVNNFNKFAIPAIRVMVLLSLIFNMNLFIVLLNFLPIVNNDVLFTSYFCIFLLVVVCDFALLHSRIACHMLFGINLKEKKKNLSFFDEIVKI